MKIETKKKTISYACVVECEAGTNGYQGGDAGHGGRAYVKFADLGGTAMEFRVTDHNRNVSKWIDAQGGAIEIAFSGDAEIGCLIEALKFAAATLERQAGSYLDDEEDVLPGVVDLD